MDGIGNVLNAQLLQWAHPAEILEGDRRGEDGLLVCGKCGKQKECRVEIAGEVHIAACMCDCQEAEWKQQKAEMEKQQRLLRLRQLPVYELHDRTVSAHRFETGEQNIYLQKCRQFSDKWDEICGEGIGLLLSGPVGCGKTYAAACIANTLADRGVGVLMTSFPAILKSQIPINEIVRESDAYDLLIVDDLGAERDTDYAAEIVYQVIDHRYKANLPLIVTTNLSREDMLKQEDMRYRRIYDRVLEMCIFMAFKGESKRTARREEKAERLRKIINGGGE